MKFRKSSTPSSPKMELLSRPAGGNRATNFKRSKSFRASMKFITKIRNHANLQVTPSYDFSQISLNPKGTESPEGKLHNLAFVPEDLQVQDCSRSRVDPKENQKKMSEVAENIAKDMESKLSLNCNVGDQKTRTKQDKLQEISVRTDKFNAYENPTFMDSSLDSSISSFFHEDDLDRSTTKFDRAEAAPEAKADKEKIENRLSVIVQNEQICKTHRWCTRVKSTSSKGIFRNAKKTGKKCVSAGSRQKDAHDNQYDCEALKQIDSGSKLYRSFPKSLKPKTDGNIMIPWIGSHDNDFLVKGVMSEQPRECFFYSRNIDLCL